jgi:hypothetical protein
MSEVGPRRTLRVAIVGAGYVAGHHLAALAPHHQVLAVRSHQVASNQVVLEVIRRGVVVLRERRSRQKQQHTHQPERRNPLHDFISPIRMRSERPS